MKIDIILAYIQRYEFGHEKDFVPPITGIHLASLTPSKHQVHVFHQQLNENPVVTDADLVAISFFSGFAPEAFLLANHYRCQGKIVIGGGPHVTHSVNESLRYFDAIVTGEAESVWPDLLNDVENRRIQRVYSGKPLKLDKLPTPRYDLLPDKFFVKKVVQATRGCPFNCSFCTVPSLSPGFRTRPVENVIADISYDNFKHWWQRKMVWFWDDNLTASRKYAEKLLKAMIPYKKWWLTQASMDISGDENLLRLMKKSGCIGIFFGIESFIDESLASADKSQNKSRKYSEAINQLHKNGICVMAGLISGLDGDTTDSVKEMAKKLYEAGVDVPFLSILTPYRGTRLYERMKKEQRIIAGRGWEYYNGYNVTFVPAKMTPEKLLEAHRALWCEAFSLKYSFLRIVRSIRYLRLGAFMVCLLMNAFYCIKRLRGNLPVNFQKNTFYRREFESDIMKMHGEES
ncbi:MAG: B12-binding domain-containing radical SAM protein [Candidatus Riflebacteria bacterium]|nr:B12-binding domain-containing radical SAM protein [Candidatus Riflebacteria bacterium]